MGLEIRLGPIEYKLETKCGSRISFGHRTLRLKKQANYFEF